MQQQKFTTIAFGLVLCGLMFVTHAEATQPTYSAGRRLALVFGNNQYTQLNNLVKAVNDATAMARELTTAGFQVINIDKYSDLDRRAMLDARDELMKELTAGDQVVIFYAGHGIQIGSEIYLIPVSFPLSEVASAERVAEESVTLQSIMDAVKKRIGADGFALYIVDACRNNPLPKTAERSIPEMLHRGLVPMQPPAGQIAIYAASNGQEALDTIKNDDPDPNGVFTRVLLKHIKKPGEPIMDILTEVQEEVIQLAKQVIDEYGNAHEQQPAIYNEARLKRPFCFYPNEYGCVQVQVVVPSVLPVVPTVVVPKLVQLTIKSNIKSSQDQVLIDGENRGSTKLVVDLEPGIHNVQVTAAGFKAWEKELELTVGTPYSVYAKLEADSSPLQAFEPEMVDISAGCFQMGSPESESGRNSNESPQHRVCVEAFAMGKYEVTNTQFRQFRSNHNSGEYEGHSLNDDNQPVVNITWNDAVAYTVWLSQQTGKNYRLPSEAEWEYAARAGTTTARYWGNNPDQACRYGNVHDETSKRINKLDWIEHNCDDGYVVTAPVGQFQPNDFGLYDMLGNVWEWNQDKWHSNYSGAPTNGCAWESGDSNSHLLRGCSWSDSPDNCRSAGRGLNDISDYDGFRVVVEM